MTVGILDLQYIQNLANDQAVAIGERFALSDSQIHELRVALENFYEIHLENEV